MTAQPALPRPAAPPAGRAVAWAAVLLTGRIVLGLAGAARELAGGDHIRAALRATNPTLSAAQAGTVYTVVLGLGAIFGLLYAAGYGVLAVRLYRGRPAAVPVARVLCGLGVLAGLGSLAGAAPFGRPLGAVLLLLDAATLALLARRPGRPGRPGR